MIGLEKVGSSQKPPKVSDISVLLNNLYRRLGAIRRIKTSEVSIGTRQPREINWNAVQAGIEADKERERRKWELWGMYGRR